MYHNQNTFIMIQKIDNQQDYDLTNEQIQVLLTGTFGDGCIRFSTSGKSQFTTSCIYEEYINYKNKLLGDLFYKSYGEINQGFKQNMIYKSFSNYDYRISKLHSLNIKDKLDLMNDLGLALWFYDDGSKHKKNLFYNLSTHAFSEEIQREYFLPFFKERLGYTPKIYKDKKKDGRIFYYLFFARHNGSYEISKLLEKYPIECYKYKLWSSETIQEWSKLKAELKSKGIEVSSRKFANILNGKASIQDIVPSL